MDHPSKRTGRHKNFSRKAGIINQGHIWHHNWLAILYDQNAGLRGVGCSFLGRPCSISPLPDLFAKTPMFFVSTLLRGEFFFGSKIRVGYFLPIRAEILQQKHTA